jgi:hypothetical protein
LKRIQIPQNDIAVRVLGENGERFFAAFPILAPAMFELDNTLAPLGPRPAINLFLLSFCRLFECQVTAKPAKPLAPGAVGATIGKMCSSGYRVKVGKQSRSLGSLFRFALKETRGDFVHYFKRAIANLYARRYYLN